MLPLKQAAHADEDVDAHKNILFLPIGDCSGAVQRCGTLDTLNNNRTWIWWPQKQTLQDKSDQDGMHNYKNQGTCKATLIHRED